ncbi:MAG: ABC transporter permease [Pseudomonadota bacterium]
MTLPLRKKIRNWFFYLLMMVGFPLLAWAGYTSISEAYQYSSHGVERSALVMSLIDKTSSTRGGTSYYYELNIEGSVVERRFRKKLTVGNTVTLLEVRDRPGEFQIGRADSSFFDIYSYNNGNGGRAVGGLILSMFAFMTVVGPWVFYVFVTGWRAFVESDHD